ncbi:MAG: FAD-binding oxidoreductase [Acidimicrobiales bacterium]
MIHAYAPSCSCGWRASAGSGWAAWTTEVLEALAAGLRGPLLRLDDPSYDAARAVWNGAIDCRPAAIARCAGTADVLHAVNVARSAGLTVAVRSGGHSFAGYSTCEGGLVIDLSGLTGIRMDVDARRARCGAGTLWGDLDHETQAFAQAAPGGVISHAGVAGLTLGGAWGGSTVGSASRATTSSRPMSPTADGHFVRASEGENPDLFWGLLGSGGNFGIVTRGGHAGPGAGTACGGVPQPAGHSEVPQEDPPPAPARRSACGTRTRFTGDAGASATIGYWA